MKNAISKSALILACLSSVAEAKVSSPPASEAGLVDAIIASFYSLVIELGPEGVPDTEQVPTGDDK